MLGLMGKNDFLKYNNCHCSSKIGTNTNLTLFAEISIERFSDRHIMLLVAENIQEMKGSKINVTLSCSYKRYKSKPVIPW